jgi:hypothetical protein
MLVRPGNLYLPPELAARSRARDLLRRASDEAPLLVDFVCPLYAPDATDRPAGVGSAVLLTVDGERLLLTAAHVVERYEEVFFPGDGVLERLSGDTLTTALPPSGRREDDRFDFAAVVLSESAVSRMTTLRFLEPQQLGTHHKASRDKAYTIMGFPSTRNKPRSARAARRNPYSYTTVSADPKIYADMCRAPAHHLVLSFNREWTRNPDGSPRGSAPDPHGFSGGAVWLLDQPGNPQLVGIPIEWDAPARSRKQFVVATRIGTILEALTPALAKLREAR